MCECEDRKGLRREDCKRVITRECRVHGYLLDWEPREDEEEDED